MKTVLLITIAAFSVACNGSGADHKAPPAGAGATGATASGSTASDASDRTVTLVGCLQGPSMAGPVGTAGSPAADRARSRAAGGSVDDTQRHGGAAGARFILTNAQVESGGVGANGAGASGGPLVTAGSSFELDGLPADAQGNVNKRVRVTGKVDARPVATGGAAGEPSPQRQNATPAPGTAGATSQRDDVRANSTAVAGDSTSRRLTVETVQVVAEGCEPR